ncbi:hypothetical protein [Vreelandella alkaliphila]|uniref:hypothetical protein n=1 Tax=Vreelandella alkaliphila TaxID=272774 RepID=UPI003FD8664B
MQTVIAFFSGVIFIPYINFILASFREKKDQKRKSFEYIYKLTIDFEREANRYRTKIHNSIGRTKKELSHEEYQKLVDDFSIGYVKEGPDPFSIANEILAMSAFNTPECYIYLKQPFKDWEYNFRKVHQDYMRMAANRDSNVRTQDEKALGRPSILSLVFANESVNDEVMEFIQMYRNDLIQKHGQLSGFKIFF